jgi:RHS repeat-associated protein
MVYNGHADVVALVDATGASVASYAYDAFGQITSASENFGGTTTWTNPYRYDGRDGVRYDGETGLYWMSVRAYDPALGRFLSRDPLGRVPLFFADQPYVYGGNNPLINVDPSGQFAFTDGMSHVQARQARAAANKKYVKWFRMQPVMKSVVVDGQTCYTRECVRTHVLRKLDAEAYNHLLKSILLAVLAAGVALAAGNTSDAIVDAAYDIVELFSNVPMIVGRLIYDSSGDAGAYSQSLRITSLVQGFVSMVERFHAWWQTASWIVKAASTAAVWTLKAAGGGVIEGVKDVTLAMLGGAASLLLNSFSGDEAAAYNAELAQENDQQYMEIGAWCAAYGHGKCNGLTW